MRCTGPRVPLLVAALACLSIPPSSAATPADLTSVVREGEDLYRQGAYSEALKKFESALAGGVETPALLYQTGSCYALATGNKDKEAEMKKRAVPLFEKEITGGSASLDSYYYLAATYVNDLKDPVKGTDVARKGVASLEKPGAAAPKTPDGLFRAGRLYSMLGKDKEAISYYDRSVQAAESGAVGVDRASYRLALEDLSAYRFKEKKYDAAAKAYASLLKLDPLRDRDRHQYGLALLLSGKPDEATATWRKAVTDDLRTELNYLSGVVTRWMQSGSPKTSKYLPKSGSIDDATLEQKINESAEVLRAVREKDAKAKQEQEEKERAELAEKEKNKAPLDPEAVKAKFKAKMKNQPPPDPNATEASGEGDPWKALREMGINPTKVPPPPPPSPERLAAEKEFFFLMTEYVKRGHLIRNFCFENGLVEMIFR